MRHRLIISIVVSILCFFALDNIINRVMMNGIDNYYGLNLAPDILLIGHSHLMLATDKERLENGTGLKVSKYCREGVNVSDKKMMVEHFFNSCNVDSLKYVLYGVDLATFTGEGLSHNSYKLFYPFIQDNYVDKYIAVQAMPTDYWLHKFIKTTRFNDEGLKNSVIRGWINNWDNLKNNTIDVESYRRQLEAGEERHIKMNDEIISQFKQTMDLITDNDIPVILVNTPTLDLLNNYESDKYDKVIQWFQEYAEGNDLIYFVDFNPKYASNYSIFSDRLHLNQHGQKIITEELITILNHKVHENPN